eukprot:scaffold80587_cov63-Phaeocystis_antarctica.AAC.2
MKIHWRTQRAAERARITSGWLPTLSPAVARGSAAFVSRAMQPDGRAGGEVVPPSQMVPSQKRAGQQRRQGNKGAGAANACSCR